MSPAQQQAASLAWQHAHPVLMVLISTVITLIVVTLIVMIRWLISQSAWRYHPGGAGGFLKDEFVRWGAILVPYLALSIGFKFFVYDLHPEFNKPEVWMGFAVVAITFRLVLRRLPFVKAMGRHIDAAKAEAKAVRAAR
jgi:heme/copper-type cytochrome/quinol oxidase subunit 2